MSTVMGWEPRGSCAIFACDVVSFGDPARTDVAKRYVRDGLYRGLRGSFDSVGIGFDACYREDRGDGALLALPPATDMSVLLGVLIHRLRAEVRRHNEVSGSSAQMRLRLAVHAGEVQWDGNGLVGTAVDHAFRILEAAPFKEAVKSSEAMVALIVSERVYGDVVRHGRGDVDPSDYWQVGVSVKETQTTAWMMAPGLRLAPTPAGDLALDGARAGGPRGPSARTMFSLKDYLLDIPLMLSPAGRDEVIGELDQDIGRNIRRYGDASSDTYSILRTCLDYPGGLRQLLETLRGFVGNSLALRRLEQEIAQMLRE